MQNRNWHVTYTCTWFHFCSRLEQHLWCNGLACSPRSGQTKDYKIGICCFSAKHTSLRRESNQDDVFEWATCLWWPSVLLLEETGELEENHRPVASSFESNYHTCPRNRLSLYINHRVFKTITLRVYYIIHFCDSIWSLWVEANLVVYIYYAFGDPIIKKEWILVFNATFSNISAISWRPVLLVEDARVPGANHRPWASNW